MSNNVTVLEVTQEFIVHITGVGVDCRIVIQDLESGHSEAGRKDPHSHNFGGETALNHNTGAATRGVQ